MAEPVVTPVCYRHPDRRAGVRCQRCDRPICPECMVQASVGFQCPECAHAGAKRSPVITPRSLERRPLVTEILIALNALVFVIGLANGGSVNGTSGQLAVDYGLLGAGQLRGGPLIGVAFGEWYRLFTGGFIHAGLLHIGMNMLVLWLLGIQVERVLGHARYAALYLASLAAGAFGVMLANPTDLTVGASGAIFGLMGAAVAFQRSQRISLMQSGLGVLILLNLVITFRIPGISIADHIGGLIGGFVTGWVLFQLDRRVRSEWAGVAVALALTGLFVLGGIWAAGHYANPVIHG